LPTRGGSAELPRMNRPPDAKVRFHLTSRTFDGAEKVVRSGYRPVYHVRPNYLTSVHHEFLGAEEVRTGGEVDAEVWFISPDAYPHVLWVGRVIEFGEGSRVCGRATVLEVINPLLLAAEAERG
jgi:hypothetical protein